MHASWLIAAFAACVCCPAAMALCWESSICSDLRSKERLLDCISLCGSRTQVSTHRSDDEVDPWLDLLLSSLGGPPPAKPLGPRARGQRRNEDQRRYVMEHFRWEKPYGRKLRPVKVAAASTEGAATSRWTGVSPQPTGGVAVGGAEQGTKDDKEAVLGVRDLEVQPLQGVTFGPQAVSLLSTQDTKDPGTYRMNHFRWGSPPKRHGRFLNLWAKEPLPKYIRNSFKRAH